MSRIASFLNGLAGARPDSDMHPGVAYLPQTGLDGSDMNDMSAMVRLNTEKPLPKI